MPKVTMTLEIELDQPLRNAEDERYLAASIEEGITYGWYDFMMNEESMPAQSRRVTVHSLQQSK